MNGSAKESGSAVDVVRGSGDEGGLVGTEVGDETSDFVGPAHAADRLRRAIALAAHHGLSSHELGDACLIL